MRLLRSENVGPVTFRALLARYGSARAALEALPAISHRSGRRRFPRLCSPTEAQAELAALTGLDARLVALGETDYPPLLAHISDPPPLLAMRGDPSLLRRPSVAIVGARNASLNGCRFAAVLARDLGAAGICVVSGLARGIDAAAHGAALPSGTVAVVAGGIDVVYPPEHGDLYAAITARGLVIAEMPLGQRPQAQHFPRRNRIISGTCQAVVVVEAGLRSGALITARMALDQGREVLAVPGSPLDPRARGSNDLIRQGAVLVESAADVIDALAKPVAPAADVGRGQLALDLERRDDDAHAHEAATEEGRAELLQDDENAETVSDRIARALSVTPVSVDEIIRNCQLSPAIVHTILLEWEMAGRIERLPGNRIAMIAFAKSPCR